MLVAPGKKDMNKGEKKLADKACLLEHKLDVMQQLRMQLIDRNIDLIVQINKLKKTNKALVKEIARHKVVEAKLRQKLKLKKAVTLQRRPLET